MEWMIVLAVVILIFSILLKNVQQKGNESHAYQQKANLFSNAERSFLGVLDLAVGNEYRILGKVRVADILSPQKGMTRNNWQSAFNKISAKHFDYVLCCKKTLKVVSVIELDDKTHSKASVKSRDQFLNHACETANLKLIRFPAKSAYEVSEVKNRVMAIHSGTLETKDEK